MWKLPLLEAKTSLSGKKDTFIVGVFQDTGKKAISPQGSYGGWVDQLRKDHLFQAQRGSLMFFRATPAAGLTENLLLVGLGLESDLTDEKLRSLGGLVWAKLVSEKVKEVAIQSDTFVGKSSRVTSEDAASLLHLGNPHQWGYLMKRLRALAEGLILSAYQFDKYKNLATKTEGDKENSNFPSLIQFMSSDRALKDVLSQELEKVTAIGEAVCVTRDWSNEPSNHGTPTYYANEAKKLARKHGLKCRVLSEVDARREKMGLFLGVGQGSDQEGKIVIVEYTPKKRKGPQKSVKTIALVGKGVTFDSGGISIKPSARMEEMKHDMTGASTVMGAILLASQWEVPHRVMAIMAFTENMPSGHAIQPGNVITARNGKTVEVINTDAEGRLILADVLDYAQDSKPDAVIDVATLTGAVSVALGKQCCAVLGNDVGLIESLERASEQTGERIWELPLFDEYFEDLKSDCADMKNSANDSNGGTIRGAIFLKQFIRKDIRWAHLDIAAMANHLTSYSYFPKKGASGIYVRTLAQFIADF